jgi:hypothetical protein
MLAIVLYASADTPSTVTYQWNGQETNPYAGGEGWEEVIGNHGWTADSGIGEDLAFRDYIGAGPQGPVTITVNLSAASHATTLSR